MLKLRMIALLCAVAILLTFTFGAVAEQSTEQPQQGEMGDGQAPPEMPDGGFGDGQTPPEMPEGGFGDGQTPPEMPDGEAPADMGDGQTPPNGEGQPGGGFGGSAEVTQGESANTITEDTAVEGEAYASEGDDENALRIDGATVTLSGITVDKTGGASSNTENGDFYGMNAALLATNGAQVTIEDAIVTSNAQNGNGVFSYGEGTVVTVSNTEIRTEQNNSGGIQTTGGATMIANNLTVETQGNSAAAIRSDRGGGTVTVDGGSYTTNGTGSPAIYSTADITVSNAALTANSSEAVVVEGKNSVALNNCVLSGSMVGTYTDGSEHIHNIMIYQSMSGDADVGTAKFSANGGSITALAGDMIYVTNTRCEIALSGVELKLANGNLLTVTGNNAARGWGTAGANGGDATVVFENQVAEGVITVDSISTLNLTLSGATEFAGSIVLTDNAEGGEATGENITVTVEEGATWTLTADSTVNHLTNNGTVNTNGYTLTVLDD